MIEKRDILLFYCPSKDFIKFLDYSRASVAETISHCYVALDQNYIDNSELSNAKDMADRTWKRINKFINYLKTNKPIKQVLP